MFSIDKYGEYQLNAKDLDKAIDWYLYQIEHSGLRKNVYWISIRNLVEQDLSLPMKDHFEIYYIDREYFKSAGQRQIWDEILDFVSRSFPDYEFEVRYLGYEPCQVIRTDVFDMWAYGTILRYVDMNLEMDTRSMNWENR